MMDDFLQFLREPIAQRSLLACVMIGFANGFVSGLVILKKSALQIGTLSCALLPGIAVAVLLFGLTRWSLLTGAVVAALLVGLGSLFVSRTSRLNQDTALSSELSGGQQQRAFLARALAQEAHVLLLDEPFTGLDAPASQSLGRLLDSLAAEGRLVIASHHDLNTAADIFDTILLMNRELAAFGPPKEVLSPARIREIYGMDPQPETQAS